MGVTSLRSLPLASPCDCPAGARQRSSSPGPPPPARRGSPRRRSSDPPASPSDARGSTAFRSRRLAGATRQWTRCHDATGGLRSAGDGVQRRRETRRLFHVRERPGVDGAVRFVDDARPGFGAAAVMRTATRGDEQVPRTGPVRLPPRLRRLSLVFDGEWGVVRRVGGRVWSGAPRGGHGSSSSGSASSAGRSCSGGAWGPSVR